MDPSNSGEFEITEDNVRRLKDKYSREMKDDSDNPIKVCMKLIFDAAIEKNTNRRSILAYDLSIFLTRPDGVINLFLALIDFDTSSQRVTTHNQRFIAVSNIITCLPKLCMSYEEYCKNISKQLEPLLICDQPKYSNLACIIIKSMFQSPHARGKDIKKIILGPIFDSLTQIKSFKKPHEAIIAIYNLIQNHVSTTSFVEIFSHLFYSLVSLYETPSRLKSLLELCLVNILNDLNPGAACCLIEKTVFHSEDISHLYIKSIEDDEISIRVANKLTPNRFDQNREILVEILISLLENTNNKLLVLEFFFHFKETMWIAKNDNCRQLSAAIIEPLLDQTIKEESTKLDLLSIIALNSGRSLELISRTLLNYVSYLRCDQKDFKLTQKLIGNSISSCFNILEVLSATLLGDEDKNIIRRKNLPVLKQIKELFSQKDENFRQNELYQNVNSLIIRLENTLDESLEFQGPQTNNEHVEREFNIITKDLNDKLVPVRVHALVRLKQLILANEHYTVSRIPQLYIMIEASLADQEPYVFLACINLIAEMAVRRTSEILPKLIDLYSQKDLNLQHRINVGEVLVRLTKQMNSTTPYYSQQVMNMLFRGCKDDEELIRMSSLSNMGEICFNLGDALGKYMIDILACIQIVIDDDTIPVKCAAIDLLRTTLSGLDKLKVESIQRELKSMYNILKKLKYQTLDKNLCLQVDLALEEVDRLARDMLDVNISRSDNKKLVKNIRLLSLIER